MHQERKTSEKTQCDLTKRPRRWFGRGLMAMVLGALPLMGLGQYYDMCGFYNLGWIPTGYPLFQGETNYTPWWLEEYDFIATPGDSSLWQYAIAQKGTLNTLEELQYVLVTDSVLPYSSFEIHSFELTFTDYYVFGNSGQGFTQLTFLGGCYQMETDSLEDWLGMEYSLDLGLTWHNLLSPEAFPEIHPLFELVQAMFDNENVQQPFLTTGSTGDQRRFLLPIGLSPVYNPNVPEGFVPGVDPIKFRISFQSGANESAKDGVMISNLYCGFGSELSVASEEMSQAKIWTGLGHLYVDLPESGGASMTIWDLAGRPVMNTIVLRAGMNETIIGHLSAGVYVYGIMDNARQIIQSGKLMVE